MKRFVVFAAALFLVAGSVCADEKPKGPPKPGPEHKKLEYFAGKWTSDGEMRESSFGPGGKMTGTDACEWFAGRYALVCKGTGKGPLGEFKSLGLLSYSPEDKVYTYSYIDSRGMAGTSKATIENGVWTFSSESKMGGKTFKDRYVIAVTSADDYTFKWEISEDGTSWNTVMAGKETRAKARSTASAKSN